MTLDLNKRSEVSVPLTHEQIDENWGDVEVAVAWFITPQQFGAVGDGTTDDTTALQAAADACKGAGTAAIKLVIPKGTYRVTTELDFTRIRHIQCIGEIRSEVDTSGEAAVTIGTESNANSDMEHGDISLTVRSSAANNAALAGVVGIRVRGAARCDFRLFSYGWDVGVEIAPIGNSGIQYVAFCRFRHVYTNRCRTGLKLFSTFHSGTATGWINQNSFEKVDCYSQSNALSSPTIGILIGGNYENNNNIFFHSSPEDLDYPIKIEKGMFNHFRDVRMESSGPVWWSGEAFYNTVENIYPSGLGGVSQLWECSRPNIVSFQDTIWMTELSLAIEDFFDDGSIVHSRKLKNSATGNTQFASGVLDTDARSFAPGGTDTGYVDLRVNTGDVFRINGKWVSGTAYLNFQALDEDREILPGTSGVGLPYLGSTSTLLTAGTSESGNSLDVTSSHDYIPFLLSVNRDEVKFVRAHIGAAAIQSLMIERLVHGGNTAFDAQHDKGFEKGIRLIESYSDTAIQDATHAVNAEGKEIGSLVWDSTNKRQLRASGARPMDDWDVIDGSESITPEFDPASLFGNGEVGMIYDPDAIVGSDGDAQASLSDISGNGFDLAQATGANRPLLDDTGGVKSLEYDGSNDRLFLSAGGALDVFRNKSYGTVITALNATSSGSQVFAVGVTTPGAGTLRLTVGKSTGDKAHLIARRTDALSSAAVVSTASIAGSWKVLCAEADWGNNKLHIALDLAERETTNNAWLTGGSTDNTASDNISLGSLGTGSFFAGKQGRTIIIDRELTAAERTNAIMWVAQGSGLTL